MTKEKEKPTVGFIGIGTMGWPMAKCIVGGGFAVSVFDMDAERASAFAKEVGAQAASLKEIAATDIVVTMLPTGKIVHEVLIETNNGEFINNAKAGSIVVDMSSSEPLGTQELGKKLAQKQVTLLDAPVSGAKPRAITGTLTLMIGGEDKSAIKAVEPVLQTMGNRLFETGGLGTGHAVKALNNFIGATSFAATSEALLIAKRFGLSQETLVDVLNVSTGQTFISDKVMKDHVLDEKYDTGFALGLLAKDVGIAAELGKAVNLEAPILNLVKQRWDTALQQQGFNADNTEAIKSWDEDLNNK